MISKWRQSLIGGAALLALSPALADSIPGHPYDGPAYFNSRSMQAVRVELAMDHVQGVSAQLRLPRAYINFANGYFSTNFRELPPEVKVTQLLMVSVRLSDLSPYVLAWRRQPTREDRDRLRRDTAFVRIYARGPAAVPPRVTSEGYEALPPFEGLSAQRRKGNSRGPGAGGIEFFEQHQREPFYKISCLESDRPLAYCRYSFLVCPTIQAEAQMVDFRYNGGVLEARRRVELLKDMISSWSTCYTEARPKSSIVRPDPSDRRGLSVGATLGWLYGAVLAYILARWLWKRKKCAA